MFNGTTGDKDITINRFGDPIFDGATVNLKNQWFDALTGRIGYAVAPNWLLYGQGGVAWINHSANLTVNTVNFGDFSKTRSGWTAGGGVEWMFARGWSAFLEGNYMDFGDHDHNLIGPVLCPAGCNFSTHAKAATVLVGVNWRWGGKAPGY